MPPPPTNEGAPAWDGRPMGVEPALTRKNPLKAETPKGRAPLSVRIQDYARGLCISREDQFSPVLRGRLNET